MTDSPRIPAQGIAWRKSRPEGASIVTPSELAK